jgi:hypothetical protein
MCFFGFEFLRLGKGIKKGRKCRGYKGFWVWGGGGGEGGQNGRKLPPPNYKRNPKFFFLCMTHLLHKFEEKYTNLKGPQKKRKSKYY